MTVREFIQRAIKNTTGLDDEILIFTSEIDQFGDEYIYPYKIKEVTGNKETLAIEIERTKGFWEK